MKQINYEKEVRSIYKPYNIDLSFYRDKWGQENLWHVDIIDGEQLRCIGKGLFKRYAWEDAYKKLKSEGKL